MADYAGTLQRLVVSRTLWLVFAWPVVGLIWQIVVARRSIARSQDAGSARQALASARVAGFGCIALAATATVGHALVLARLPAGARVLFEPVARGARHGDVDAGIELLLDTHSLAACGLACLVALGAAAMLAMRPAVERGWRPWAWLQLALAGALLSFLGDGFLTVAIGWALASAAGAWLAGWHDVGGGVVVATRGAAALAAMLIGAALLFWGLGGSWDDEGYAPDSQPRFAAVHDGSTPGSGDASLTMTSLAGATVFVDDARTSSLRSPFVRSSLGAGSHTLRVHPGDGADDALLGRVDAAPGEEITLVPLGPTLSFHTMGDQFAVRGRGGSSVERRAADEHVGPGGLAVVAAALIALLSASGAMSAWFLPMAAPRVLVGVAAGATTAALGPFLLVRLAFLFPSAQNVGVIIASVGAAIVLASVWRALDFGGTRRWLVFAAGAPAGLTCVALGLGDVTAALGVMVTSGLVAATVFFVASRSVEDDGAIDGAMRGSMDDAMLVRAPARLGELVASMEHWVVSSVASAMGGTARVVAWTVAMADEHVVSTPADIVATRLERTAQAVESWVGAGPARLAWGLLTVAGLAALLHAAWPWG